MAGQVMLQTIMDITPEPREVAPAPADFLTRDDDQSFGQLLAGAVESFSLYQAKQPLAAFTALETAARLYRRAYDPSKGFGALADGAPATRFNKAVERKRTYATGEMTLDSVKNIAKVTQTTVNDVFLAVCGGGLRRYFERTGELPAQSMTAGCPVSLRQPGDSNPNNQVTMMMVSMATDESDPGERLQTIAQSARTAQRIHPGCCAQLRCTSIGSGTAGGAFWRCTDTGNDSGAQSAGRSTAVQRGGFQRTGTADGALSLRCAGADPLSGINSCPLPGGEHHRAELHGQMYFAMTACARRTAGR